MDELTARSLALLDHLPSDFVVGLRTAAWLWGLDVLTPGAHADHPIELLHPARTTPTPAIALFRVPDLPSPALVPEPRKPRQPRDPPDGVGSLGVCGPYEEYEAALPAEHVTTRSGVRVTTFARTALDCARRLPRRDAVAALDQFLREGVDPRDLARMIGPAGYRRSRRIGRALADADPGAESPGESRARVLLLDAGFPRPRTQVPVMGPRGEWVYVDLGYDDLRVGLEYDGERHHSGVAARAHDEHRRRWLRREMNWEVIPVCRDFFVRPVPYLEALLTAMLQHGWQPCDATLETISARLVRLRHPIGRTVR